MSEMQKSFDPAAYEGRWRRFWADGGFFRAEAPSDRPPFCIMIPPPNVTGRLHMGHALQSTLQDLLTRWRRMQGYNALWLPGTDHAGIATQLMVERQIESEGSSRVELGREQFLARCWEWKEQHHGNIREQLDRLGASCDWSRERFTMDPELNRAVVESFVRQYREGLITRDEYMVNWSPGLNTAVSDLEVEMRMVQGHLWHIAYPVEGSSERIVVATTRPETMLGDTAVALHPDDDRYRHLIGKYAVLPIVGRRLPFVADEAVDSEFGSGLVKVTPAHDPADFEMGRRHNLEAIQVIDQTAHMTEAAGEGFAGLDRFVARERVVERLRADGLLVKVEAHEHNVGHCQRSEVPIEPLISTQWFADVSGMAERALGSVRDGRLTLVPDSWVKTWEHWLENIRPWCISRQLWWGHQIPAWYSPDGSFVVAHDRAEAERLAGTTELEQDPDVLDTWFSSGLWPMSTLGWPEDTEDFRTFYPTQVMITGFDILFFWVARMVMLGLHFTDREPYSVVHLTGLVRDADGRKMSKTRGNTVDPLDLVEEYGADALRFTLAALDVPGRDIPLDQERMAGYRSFGNKIWNAVRFALSRTGSAQVADSFDLEALEAPERWILSRLSSATREVCSKLEAFRFDEACHRLYHFFWGDLCDWYIELSKPALFGDARRPFVGEVLLSVLDQSLRLLHPVMPFLTEELWQRLPGRERVHAETIALAPYPEFREDWLDEAIEASMGEFIAIVGRIRNLRAELGVPPGERIGLVLATDDVPLRSFLESQVPLAGFLARLDRTEFGPIPETAVRDRVGDVQIGLLIPEREMGEAERNRLSNEIAKLEDAIARAEAQLANDAFVSKAPPQVVQKRRDSLHDMKERLVSLQAGLAADA